MVRRWFTVRTLVALASVGLIAAGVWQLLDGSRVMRPEGRWQDIRSLAERDDLNVVFVLVDMLRADRLSTYGYERTTSPILDTLAESAIVFENVTAQSSWTKTSMASLWTGTYPSTNGIARYQHGLPGSVSSPAEILREAGFRTVGIWRNGWVAPNFGFGQGFDLYYKPVARKPQDGLRQDNPSAFQLGGSDHDLTRSAVAFLENAPESRFLLYLHYMDVHQYVYDDSADFGTAYSDIYDNSIHWVDRNLGTLWAILQREGLMENTIFVVASDHGEEFGEHGGEGHARTLYREVTHVPLVMALPFRLEEGIRVSSPVENVDIWPTLLDLLGLPPLPGAQGRSLVPLIEAAAQGAEPADGSRPRYAQIDRTWGGHVKVPNPLVTVAEGGFRLFHEAQNPGEEQLYDLESDPWEQHDVSEQHPEQVERLMTRLDEYMGAPPPEWGGPAEVAIDDFELAQLRALGYVMGDEDEDEDEEASDEAQGAGDGDDPAVQEDGPAEPQAAGTAE